MNSQTYRLSAPDVTETRDLLEAGARFCSTALLVRRPNANLHREGIQLLSRLHPHLLREEESNHWPGTQLLIDTAVVYRYALNEESLGLLVRMQTPLFAWVQPERPEDLCLLRADGSPWLVSISHEREAFVELHELELETIRREFPRVHALLAFLDGTPEAE